MRGRLALIILLILLAPTGDLLIGQEDNSQPVFSQKAVSRMKVYRLELYGNFVYEKVSTISAPIKGIVQAVKVQRGEQVNEGQTLMVVRRDEPGFTAKQTRIKAPFGGVIQAINAYEGVRFSPQTPLLTLAAHHPLYLYADVLESDLAKIKANDQVDIRVRYIDGAVQGRIVGLLEVDPGKRLARVRVEVANPRADIKAGTEGKIHYVYKQAEVVLVPAEAVFPEKGRYYIWLNQGGRAERREVQIGELTDNGFEVLTGVAEGEAVIYYGYLDLEEGDRVTVMNTMESDNEF